jgi:hypothetical protein
MGEGQNKRKIGSGMKPRGNKRFKKQKETNSMTEQSTTEGQQAPPKEAVLGPKDGNESRGNLEPENGEKLLQNLEKSEIMVAHDDALICPSCGKPFIWNESVGAFEHDDPCQRDAGLEAAMKESAGGVIDAEFSEVDDSPELIQVLGEPFGTDLETAMAVGTGTVKDFPPLHPAAAEALGQAMRQFADQSQDVPSIGLQPDGSTKVIVTIPEGVFEPVNELAKDRRISLERWCDEFFNEALDAYFSPAGKR